MGDWRYGQNPEGASVASRVVTAPARSTGSSPQGEDDRPTHTADEARAAFSQRPLSRRLPTLDDGDPRPIAQVVPRDPAAPPREEKRSTRAEPLTGPAPQFRLPESNRTIPGETAGAAAAKALNHRRRSSVSGSRWILEWLLVVFGAIAVALLIKAFFFQAFRIPSESMVPTLNKGDRVLVNKVSYDLHDVNRGDVVVFSRPPNFRPDDPEAPKDLIKRVIGLPGDTVEARSGKVYVNGRAIDESGYLPAGVTTSMTRPIKVPKGRVLVMGDNRNFSEDGRVFGPISQDLIVGRAFARIWPPGRTAGL